MIKGPEANQWKEAMYAEMNQLNEMGTWKKQDLPEEWKAIGCRWVSVRKKDEHGNTKLVLSLKDFHRSLELIIWITAPLHQ